MKRMACLTVLLFLTSALPGRSDDESKRQGIGVRAEQFHRDADLVQALVEGALKLAGEKDPVQRADCYQILAAKVAQEVRRANASGDDHRAAALARHIDVLWREGVAENLTAAKAASDAAARQNDIDRVALSVAKLGDSLQQLERQLPASGQQELRQALGRVAQARGAVERALATPGR
jgi:hypothetical protein